MLDTAVHIALWVTVAITGFYAVIFMRDAEDGMKRATHIHELLPRVMAGRYVVVFLFSLGVLAFGNGPLIAYFFAICTFLGLYDGWLYYRRGLPHFKHTITGLLALIALVVSVLALMQPSEAQG